MLPSYSHHSLEMFRTCPRRFKFRYVERVEVPAVVTADLYLGDSVHRALARLHEAAGDGILLSLDDLLDFYQKQWEKPDRKPLSVRKDYATVEDYVQAGRNMLATYYRRYQPFRQGRLLGVELRLACTLPTTRFRLNGRIDRLWKREDGTIEICDYKTGRRLPQGRLAPSFFHQMGLYQVIVQAMFSEFSNVEVAQYHLRQDVVIRHRLEPDEIAELAEATRADILGILDAGRLDDFPTVESEACSYCEFFHLCPAKRHQLLLQQDSSAPAEATQHLSYEAAATLADSYIDLDTRFKRLKAEHDAMKEEIVQTAKRLQVDKLVGEAGEVIVKYGSEEKFVSKSSEPSRFVELSQLVRQLGLYECLTIDQPALKDVYQKQRLSPQHLEQLRQYLILKDFSRVSARPSLERSIDADD